MPARCLYEEIYGRDVPQQETLQQHQHTRPELRPPYLGMSNDRLQVGTSSSCSYRPPRSLSCRDLPSSHQPHSSRNSFIEYQHIYQCDEPQRQQPNKVPSTFSRITNRKSSSRSRAYQKAFSCRELYRNLYPSIDSIASIPDTIVSLENGHFDIFFEREQQRKPPPRRNLHHIESISCPQLRMESPTGAKPFLPPTRMSSIASIGSYSSSRGSAQSNYECLDNLQKACRETPSNASSGRAATEPCAPLRGQEPTLKTPPLPIATRRSPMAAIDSSVEATRTNEGSEQRQSRGPPRRLTTWHPQPQVSMEIQPGLSLPVRTSQETRMALERGFVDDITCLVCSCELLCVRDASFVICPDCRSVSPKDICLNGNDERRSWLFPQSSTTNVAQQTIAIGLRQGKLHADGIY